MSRRHELSAPGARARRSATAERLSRGRIVRAAVDLADREGLSGVSMRRLAQDLGVDPMSLYHHVGGKEELLGAMADAIVAEVDVVAVESDWQEAVRATILAARATMLQHPWAATVIESLPTPTPAVLQYLNGVLSLLRAAGFSVGLTHHAVHVLGSRLLGFSQDLYSDNPDVRPTPEVAAAQAKALAETWPVLAELAVATTHEGGLGGCDDDEEFAFALDLLLEGLERRRRSESPG